MKILKIVRRSLCLLIFCCAGLTAASAATLTVTSTGDATVGAAGCADGCGLREAINTAAAGDTIIFAASTFNAPQVIGINGQLTINKNLTVNGPGANLLTIRNAAAAGSLSRVFNTIGGAAVGLSGLTISGGNLNSGDGGGILNTNAVLTLTDSQVTGNQTTGIGGGIRNDPGSTLNIIRCTISNNTGTIGGGIDNSGGMLVESSTISGNVVTSPGNSGGGIGTGGTGTGANGVQTGATIRYSTITNNTAPSAGDNAGGIKHSARALTIYNTLIAGNVSAINPDIYLNAGNANLVFTSNGYNLIGNLGSVSRATVFSAGDRVGLSTNPINPLLTALGDYGGTTPTHALLAGSPAIDAGKCQGCGFDQRGSPRPVDLANFPNAQGGDGSDIGAFETLMPVAAPSAITGRVTAGGRGLANARVALTGAGGQTRIVATNAFGYFAFPEVESGATYLVSVSAKGRTFAPQIVSLTANVTGLVFAAL